MSKRRIVIISVISAIIVLGLILMGSVWYRFRHELGLLQRTVFQGEQTYLVLFQNSLEMRPTGGFLGNFAEVTVNNGRLVEYQLYNTNAFDYDKPGIVAPKPFQDILEVKQQQLRDANWSPDFPTSAQLAKDLYVLEGGTKEIDGVIAITSHLLPTILEVTGPVYIETMIDEAINKDNVLLKIQYDTNYGFLERGTERANRKESLQQLVRVIEQKIWRFNPGQWWQMMSKIYTLAAEHQILAYFEDDSAQEHVSKLNWDGAIESTKQDYFMLVDANLGALKTDYYMNREVVIEMTPCGDKLCHTAYITYHNTAKEPSPLNNRYRSYTRVLLPGDAYIQKISNIERRGLVDYEDGFGKKIAGFVVIVPVGEKKTIQVEYTTPLYSQYSLMIQKQPGIVALPVGIKYADWTESETIRKSTVFTKR